jgi:outer membrane lipoprotein-sorting protein
MKVFLYLLLLFFFSVMSSFAESSVRVDSVQADFVQEKSLPILARPLISTGKFLFQAPESLRWEYSSPLSSVLLMNNGQVRKFVKHEGEFVEEHGMGLDSMQIVLQEITGWLDGEITDTPTFLAKRTGKDTIVLTPRKDVLAKIINRIELKLQGESGLMQSVTLYEGENSFTRMIFSNSRLNVVIPEGNFKKP